MIAGIDIGKFYLDVSIGGIAAKQFDNTPEGITLLQNKLLAQKVTCIICEPTGGYERLLVKSFQDTMVSVQVVHPNKVRAFAQASGVLAKTDNVDAQILFRFGEMFGENNRVPVADNSLKLRDILRRRQQLIDMRVQEMNRLEKTPEPETQASCERHLAWLEEEIVTLEQVLKQQLDEPELKALVELYSSVKGIGVLTAATLIAELPELGRVDSKPLTALVGLAPWSKESGKYQGYRSIRGGRAKVRKALYMAALSTIRRDGEMRQFYQRLRKRGKVGKVALVAVMRKMLILLNAIAHRGTPWMGSAPVR